MLYFFIPWGILVLKNKLLGYPTFFTDFMGFSFLTPLVFLLQSILLFLYFFKEVSKKAIFFISASILFFHSTLAIIPFEYCDNTFIMNKSSCDCVGIKKNQLFGTECVGVREKCYDLGSTKKYEKPCEKR